VQELIADALLVSAQTVEYYLDHIDGRMAVSARAAVIWAVRQGLVD
jgi:DNA-binding CsgD family transcriptional regulator